VGTVAEAFSLAFKHHQAGGFSEAERLYRQVLVADPGHVDAWSCLGAICQAQGKLNEAEGHYRRALKLAPAHASSHNCLGVFLALRGDYAEAVNHFQCALVGAPHNAEIHHNLGLAFARQAIWAEAAKCYRQALQLKPDYAEARNRLADALTNWGLALDRQNQLEQAIDRLQDALGLKPDSPDAHNNVANTLVRQGSLDEAAAHYERALRLQPTFEEARTNLGSVRKYQGRFEEALALYEQGLAKQPDHADRHFNRAILCLLLGNWAQGWQEYEWRWQAKGFPRLSFSQPRWDGSPLAGRIVLVLAEQGLGDTIQFIRYVPLIPADGGRVIVRCQPSLLPLLSESLAKEDLVAEGRPLPPFDVYVPLLSLPGIMGTVSTSVPANVPYLTAAPKLVEHWREQLALSNVNTPDAGQVFRIGIAWQGSPTFPGDRQRSIPLEQFAPLAKIEGVRLISLQKGPGTEQLNQLNGEFAVHDFAAGVDEGSGAFMDTAAIIKNLDLVIASDTAVAHLAGALGVPVWVALAFVPDWRWLLQCEDTPWYPSMRLFRQIRPGHWEGVFDSLAKQVRILLAGRLT
jgi:tetratricopeptide (TPR) repeat protein